MEGAEDRATAASEIRQEKLLFTPFHTTASGFCGGRRNLLENTVKVRGCEGHCAAGSLRIGATNNQFYGLLDFKSICSELVYLSFQLLVVFAAEALRDSAVDS